ncbi:MAG: hypothetical protein WCO09_04410 [bacterium]
MELNITNKGIKVSATLTPKNVGSLALLALIGAAMVAASLISNIGVPRRLEETEGEQEE